MRHPFRVEAGATLVALVAGLLSAACGGGDGGPASPATVASVTVSPSALTLNVGDARPLSATALDAHGAALTGKTASWSSDNQAIATVSSTGLVTAIATGTVSISASIDGVTGHTTVTVQPRSAQAVKITPPSATVSEGDTVRLAATVRDAQGNPIAGKTVAWASDAPNVATVASSGTVTGVAAGTANVSATVDGQSGASVITVQALPKLVLNTQAQVAQDVNSIGATLTAVSAGVTYHLIVPPGALQNGVHITMTPIVAERRLPEGGIFVRSTTMTCSHPLPGASRSSAKTWISPRT